MTGQIQSITHDTVTLKITERHKLDDLRQLMGERLDIKIDKHRKARSLSANAYAWALMGQIARELSTSDNEVYHIMLTRYGHNKLTDDGAVKTVSTQYDLDGYEYIHSAPIGKSELNGKAFTHYRLIIGSSEYDTKQMAQFIDGIVSEAKELGIETLPPDQLSAMVERWSK